MINPKHNFIQVAELSIEVGFTIHDRFYFRNQHYAFAEGEVEELYLPEITITGKNDFSPGHAFSKEIYENIDEFIFYLNSIVFCIKKYEIYHPSYFWPSLYLIVSADRIENFPGTFQSIKSAIIEKIAYSDQDEGYYCSIDLYNDDAYFAYTIEQDDEEEKMSYYIKCNRDKLSQKILNVEQNLNRIFDQVISKFDVNFWPRNKIEHDGLEKWKMDAMKLKNI